MIVNDIEVKVNGIEGMTNAEIENYIHLVYEKTHEKIHSLDLTAAKDGKVDIHYILQPQKFERIRRPVLHIGTHTLRIVIEVVVRKTRMNRENRRRQRACLYFHRTDQAAALLLKG